jgi:hypothetical protein
MEQISNNAMILPASYAMVDAEEMSYVDGGSLADFFKNITVTVTIGWNGGGLPSVLGTTSNSFTDQLISAVLKTLSFTLKLNLVS